MFQKVSAAILLCISGLSGCGAVAQSGVQVGFAPVESGQLYYEVSGSGDAVVLIHGNAGDLRHWNQQFRYLAASFRVIRYDVRGYGKSSEPVPGRAYSDASDLADLLDHLAVENAHIVGWSFGSGVAFDFAIMFPERTISLTSVGPWVRGYSSKAVDDFSEQVVAVARAVQEGGAEAGSNAFVDLILSDTIFDESAEQFMRDVAAEYSWWAFKNKSQAIALKPSAASRLDKLIAPVLVITSEYDLAVCREVGDFVVANAPSSRQVVLKNTGHLMHIEKPDSFNAELLAFLKVSP